MNDKNYYEEMWAKSFDENTGCKSYNPAKAIEEILKFLEEPSGSEIAIDLGCGTGRHTQLLIERGYQTISVDFSYNALRNLKRKLPLAKIIQADVTNIPIESSLADLILDSGCLHHLDSSLYEKYISEVNRIIKPKKHMILYQFRVRGDRSSNLEGNHFTKYFSENELKSLFLKDWEFLYLNPVLGETGKPYWISLLRKKE